MQVPVPEFVGDVDTKTTSRAAYAAVDANISALLAFVITPTLAAKSTVNAVITPSCTFSWSKRRSRTIAPRSRIAATTVLTVAATHAT